MRGERFVFFQTVIGIALLAMVLLSSLALGANRPVSWTLLTVGVTLIFALQTFVMFVNPTPLAMRRAVLPGVLLMGVIVWGWVQSTPGLLPQFAHPIWAFVSETSAQPAISADPGQGRHAVMRLVCYTMVFVIMVWTCAKSDRAGMVLKLIALFSSALAAYGMFAFATGIDLIFGEDANTNLVRASFVNRNNYATYAAFGALANIAAYLLLTAQRDNNLRGRLESFFSGAWVFALGALLCLGAVSLTQSRAGGASAVLGLAVFLAFWLSGRRRWDPILPLVIVGVLIFIGATSATGLLERLISTDSADGRFAVYPAIIEAILDRPLLGHGIGAFHEAFRPYIPLEAASAEWDRAHSTYFELAFGLGIPATIVFFLAQILVVWKIWRGATMRRDNRVFACFALGCVATAALHSGFDFSLEMPATASLFAVILALGFAQSFTRSEVDAAMTAARKRDNR